MTDLEIPAEVPAPQSGGPVRVLINALHAKTGGGRTYLLAMAPRLAEHPDLDVTVLLHDSQKDLGRALASDPRSSAAGLVVEYVSYADGFARRLIWEQLHLPRLARSLKADVTFSPANFGPLRAPNPVILLRNALDVARVEKRLSKRVYWLALRAMTIASLKTCKRAIAVSGYAAGALVGGRSEAVRRKLRMVHHGVDPFFSPSAEIEREPLLLFVGDIYVQKNLLNLLIAFDGLVSAGRPERLFVAGAAVDHGYAQEVETLIAERGLQDRVLLLGRQSPDQLRDLYRRCRLFVFPSLVETFGNPLVEAMACGAAIAASRRTAMPEVLGGAGVLFNPDDPREMAQKIGETLDDPTILAALRQRSLKRAETFSWDGTALRTAEVLKAAAL
ncbi:MAG: glycosyltransferase family 4 protein [Magnetovibrionaceae bacterium]